MLHFWLKMHTNSESHLSFVNNEISFEHQKVHLLFQSHINIDAKYMKSTTTEI